MRKRAATKDDFPAFGRPATLIFSPPLRTPRIVCQLCVLECDSLFLSFFCALCACLTERATLESFMIDLILIGCKIMKISENRKTRDFFRIPIRAHLGGLIVSLQLVKATSFRGIFPWKRGCGQGRWSMEITCIFSRVVFFTFCCSFDSASSL